MQGHSAMDVSVNNKFPRMDINVLWISVFKYPCFYGYPFGYSWISVDIHVLTNHGFSIQGDYEARSSVHTSFLGQKCWLRLKDLIRFLRLQALRRRRALPHGGSTANVTRCLALM